MPNVDAMIKFLHPAAVAAASTLQIYAIKDKQTSQLVLKLNGKHFQNMTEVKTSSLYNYCLHRSNRDLR